MAAEKARNEQAMAEAQEAFDLQKAQMSKAMQEALAMAMNAQDGSFVQVDTSSEKKEEAVSAPKPVQPAAEEKTFLKGVKDFFSHKAASFLQLGQVKRPNLIAGIPGSGDLEQDFARFFSH